MGIIDVLKQMCQNKYLFIKYFIRYREQYARKNKSYGILEANFVENFSDKKCIDISIFHGWIQVGLAKRRFQGFVYCIKQKQKSIQYLVCLSIIPNS